MSVFQVDDSGELVRQGGGFVRLRGFEEIRQDVTVYLRLIRGEIPTRLDLGLPWLDLLGAAVSVEALEQLVAETGVLSRPGVVSVDDVQVTLAGVTRLTTVSYRAVTSLDDQRRRAILDAETVVPL